MDTRRRKIEAVAITVMIAISVFGAVMPSASATISNLTWTDGNDYVVFCNETVTFTWVDDTNTTNEWGLSNLTNGSHIIHRDTVYGTYDPSTGNYEFEYSLTNYTGIYGTENATTTLVFAVNGSGNPVTNTDLAQLKKQFAMNNYSINLLARNLLAGTIKDDIFIIINTSGPSPLSSRATAFTADGITTNSTGTTFTLNMSSATGNGTVNATIGNTPGHYWVNVTTGSAERVDYFNVTNLTIETTKVRAGQDMVNFSYLNLTGGNATVDYPVLVNITIDDTMRPGDEFNSSLAVDGNRKKINITLLPHHNNWTRNVYEEPYGNYTNPIEINTSSTPGPGRLIIDTNVTGDKKWYVPYEVVPATTNITGEVSPLRAHVGDVINISSWTTNPGTSLWANITYYNGSAMVYVENISITPDSTYGTNTTTWDTNATWHQWFAHNRTFVNNPENFTVNITDASGNYTLCYVELYDYMVTSTDALEVSPVEGAIPINRSFNITVNSSMRNATAINLTITALNATDGTVIINNTASKIITNYNATTYNSSVVVLYNTSYNYSELIKTAEDGFWGMNGVGKKVLTIKANDTAWNTTTTVTLIDEINITSYPETGVPGQTVTIKGKTLRHNGTMINYTVLHGDTGYKLYTLGNTTYGYNESTGYSEFILRWNTTNNGTTAGTDLPSGTYKIYLNDTFVMTSEISIELTTGKITSCEISPDLAGIDDVVWFNGTTNLGDGTMLNVNITKDGKVINNTINVSVTDGKFNVSWLPRLNETEIKPTFVKPTTTYQVNVSNETYRTFFNTNLTLLDNLTIGNVTIARGDKYTVKGITTRQNNTNIRVTTVIIPTLIEHVNTTVAYNGQYNASFNATVDNATGGDLLSIGQYEIKADDNVTTAMGTLTVEEPSIEIVSPSAGEKIEIGTNVSISGNTNRGDGYNVSITISGPTGVPEKNATVHDGSFTYYWNTSSSLPGIYYIKADSGASPGATADEHFISVELIPAVIPGPPSITDFSPTDTTPANVEGESKTFSITVNQTVDVSWQINGTEVQTNTSVTEASYTNASAVIGV
ncbi:hypothetical protein DRO24_04170, partial [Candidatus Bathyarchaeota archaeon]